MTTRVQTHPSDYTHTHTHTSQLSELTSSALYHTLFILPRLRPALYYCYFITCVSYAEARNRYRLDVCPSVTRWYCIKTAERIVMISSPHDSPFILVLCVPRSSRNSDGVIPREGAKYRLGIKKIARFSTNKSLYLANDTRYRHGCYGRRIGNHTQAFE